jgi:gamma-glutamylcyclotransferase (GGCT)/AIG2-like uncharacterized protein YtfP
MKKVEKNDIKTEIYVFDQCLLDEFDNLADYQGYDSAVLVAVENRKRAEIDVEREKVILEQKRIESAIEQKKNRCSDRTKEN